MITVTSTRHSYGTADVRVNSDETVTAASLATGTMTTVIPETYYIDDEHKAGDWWTVVIVLGRPLRKDGTPAARVTRISLRPERVPAEIRAALAEMRPDLAAWLA